jgi:GTP pyrophosphokinase
MIEVLTSPSRRPSRDWLNFVVTSRAKSKIRHWLNTEQKQRSTEIGRRLLDRELRRVKASPKRALDSEAMKRYLSEEGIADVDDLASRIGFGKLAARQVVSRVLPGEQPGAEPEKPGAIRKAVSKLLPFTVGGGPIVVKGHGDLLAFLAKCCSPLPGEEIVGYITRGRGVSVHSVDCPNVRNLLYNPEREIEVEWARRDEESYPIALAIETEDHTGMLARLAEAIAGQESNITHLEADTRAETGRGTIQVVVQVRNRRHLEKLVRRIQAVSGVLRVDRRMGSGAAG